MNSNACSKKLILNPVLRTSTNCKTYEDPAIFTYLREKHQLKNVKPSLKSQRRKFEKIKNVNTLLKRFPGLQKSKAKAALIAAGEKLDGAILILETIISYQEKIDSNQVLEVQNISIKLEYTLEEIDPSLRYFYCDNKLGLQSENENGLCVTSLIADSVDNSNSTESHQSSKKVQKVQPSLENQKRLKSKNRKNVWRLLKRFPGLKKYKAEAALTVAENKLVVACLIVITARCYQKKVNNYQTYGRHLKNIYINFLCSQRKTDPTLRSIVDKNCGTNNTSSVGIYSDNNNNDTVKRQSSRVGVIITKTLNGHYKVSPLN